MLSLEQLREYEERILAEMDRDPEPWKDETPAQARKSYRADQRYDEEKDRQLT